MQEMKKTQEITKTDKTGETGEADKISRTGEADTAGRTSEADTADRTCETDTAGRTCEADTAGKTSEPLELYIHIPFCVRKCAYCDFLSFAASKERQEAYFKALWQEIAAVRDTAACEVKTVFFGGGTPSVPAAEFLVKTMEALGAAFRIAPGAEISLEANPGTLTKEKLRVYRQAGFNRLSIGCQSIHEEELRLLGRIHTFPEFQESFRLAREAGFSNINVDLMSGLPGQTMEKWEESLRVIAQMEPEHISAYSLIVEPGTPLAAASPVLPDEDTERQMYDRTWEILKEYGFRQYEISNYAKEGFACRHNIGYWNRTQYLGFGPGAASLYQGQRFHNTADMDRYLKNSASLETIREEREILTQEACMEEFMFLGLRMTDGISAAAFEEQFGRKPAEVYKKVLDKYCGLGMLEQKQGRISLTRQGISVSNVILADFLF